MNIRLIKEKDNEAVARIIRATLEEFGANQPGTVYYDQSIPIPCYESINYAVVNSE